MGHDLGPVIVTGAAGYLGSRVADRVAESRTCLRVDRFGPAESTLLCDLTVSSDVAALIRETRPSAIIHCAAIVPKVAAEYANSEAALASLQMVRNLLASPDIPAVFASSMTVYPDADRVLTEDDAAPAGDGYASQKFAAERLLLASARSVSILRLPGLFGASRRQGVLFNAALAFAERRAFTRDNAAAPWSGLFVDDAATLFARALSLSGHNVLNVGYDGRMAVPDAISRLATVFGIEWHGPPSRWFSPDLTRMHSLLGRLDHDFDSRLRDVAAWARQIAAGTLT